jgi:hypothetical protein
MNVAHGTAAGIDSGSPAQLSRIQMQPQRKAFWTPICTDEHGQDGTDMCCFDCGFPIRVHQ